MQWKTPKNTDKYYWTAHVAEKMHYYGLSEQKVLGVIRNPKRTETGIAPSTVAVMLPVGNVRKANSPRKSASTWASARQFSSAEENWNQEIWVMYQLREINRQQSTNNNQQTEVGKIKNKVKDKKSIISNLKFQISNSAKPKICIISAWRYPGVSPKNNPIPEEIFRELEEINDQ
jgi:hypothetical protein